MSKGHDNHHADSFRCHDGGAVGSDIAPDLRNSLGQGVRWNTFPGTAKAERPDRAYQPGRVDEKDLRQINAYVKARQLDLVPPCRPPSSQDPPFFSQEPT